MAVASRTTVVTTCSKKYHTMNSSFVVVIALTGIVIETFNYVLLLAILVFVITSTADTPSSWPHHQFHQRAPKPCIAKIASFRPDEIWLM